MAFRLRQRQFVHLFLQRGQFEGAPVDVGFGQGAELLHHFSNALSNGKPARIVGVGQIFVSSLEGGGGTPDVVFQGEAAGGNLQQIFRFGQLPAVELLLPLFPGGFQRGHQLLLAFGGGCHLLPESCNGLIQGCEFLQDSVGLLDTAADGLLFGLQLGKALPGLLHGIIDGGDLLVESRHLLQDGVLLQASQLFLFFLQGADLGLEGRDLLLHGRQSLLILLQGASHRSHLAANRLLDLLGGLLPFGLDLLPAVVAGAPDAQGEEQGEQGDAGSGTSSASCFLGFPLLRRWGRRRRFDRGRSSCCRGGLFRRFFLTFAAGGRFVLYRCRLSLFRGFRFLFGRLCFGGGLPFRTQFGRFVTIGGGRSSLASARFVSLSHP